MRITRVAPAAAIAALALVLTGCGSTSSTTSPSTTGTSASSSPSDSGSPGSTYSTDPAVAGPTYVALGDSYTAAPLVPDTAIAPDNPCLRSTGNYPSIVAKSFPDLTLEDVSCSGATITSMIGVQDVRNVYVPAQFDALSDQTKLVTIGLGGNAYSLFSSVVTACATLGTSGQSGSPCEDKLKAEGYPVQAHLRDIQTEMASVLTGIKARAPHARIVLVGYPQPVPTTGSCPSKLPLSAGDAVFVASVISGLDSALQHAAATTHVPYVDMETASKGHDICSADPWVNGIVTDPTAALALHPFAAEQQAAASLVLAALKNS